MRMSGGTHRPPGKPPSRRPRRRLAPYSLGWVDIAIDHYLALTVAEQLLDDPQGPGCHRDPASDLWTTTDGAGAGLIIYTFRRGKPRLVIMRLVY